MAADENLLFKGKYRITSPRMPGRDYADPGRYFVTICTRDREHWFGKVVNGAMELSSIGKIIADEWQKTAIIRPYVTLGEWIIMPNHFHSITEIQPVQTSRQGVSATEKNIQSQPHPYHHPQWKPGCLGAIINNFKSACTRRIREMGCTEFGWQSRFHEHIIRNDDEHARIAEYIRNNPAKWDGDCFR